MQPLPSAPPPPFEPPVKKGTPFLHCAAGASVWYVAFALVFAFIAVRMQLTFWNLVVPLLVGAAFWALTSTATWLMLLKVRIRPWVLVFVTIPVYLVVYLVLHGMLGAIGVVLMYARG